MTKHSHAAMRGALLAVGLLAATAPTAAQFVPAGRPVYAGEAVPLAAPDGADTLWVTYRPSSNLAHTVALPTASGGARWIPARPGIASVSDGAGTAQTVSVRFSARPVAGWLVLVLAGGVLFGGAGAVFYRAFSGPSSRSPTPLTRRFR